MIVHTIMVTAWCTGVQQLLWQRTTPITVGRLADRMWKNIIGTHNRLNLCNCYAIYITYVQFKRRKANWLGHVLGRNCLLKHITEEKIEGRMEVTER
jgi:hypothetical protein